MAKAKIEGPVWSIDGETLSNVLLKDSHVYGTYNKITQWWDGTAMDDTKVDSEFVYTKYDGQYIRVNQEMGQVLQKDTMAQMRDLSLKEVLFLRIGYYKHVQLNGYYSKGDTPAPIDYYLSTTSAADDGGAIIDINGTKLVHNFNGVIHLSYFGVISDAYYFNEGNNRYYRDSAFTEPCFDNRSVFLRVLNYTNRFANSSGEVEITMPTGNTYSSRQLELTVKGLSVYGTGISKLITSAPTSLNEVQCLYIKGAERFTSRGVIYENIIEDKSISSNATSRYYHIWLRDSLGRFIEYCDISNNTFIDRVSTPNSTAKPYNGSILVSSGKNINIYNNEFHNSCGRIIYLNDCDNFSIHDNKLYNVGYLSPEVTDVNVGDLVFRILSSVNGSIHNNQVYGTLSENVKSIESVGVHLGMNEERTNPSSNVTVKNNTFEFNKLNMYAFELSAIKDSSIFGNTVVMGADENINVGRFLHIQNPFGREWAEYTNVFIRNNNVENAHARSIEFQSSSFDANKIKIAIEDNLFNTKGDNVTVFYIPNQRPFTQGMIRSNRNKLYKNGVYLHSMTWGDYIDSNEALSRFNVSLTAANYENYFSPTGILDVPIVITDVSISVSTPISISNITIGGQRPVNRQIELRNTTVNQVTILNTSAGIRTPGVQSVVIPVNGVVLLRFISTYWVVVSKNWL